MPLEPRQDYSAMVYGELLSAVGSRLVELMGREVALGVFSRVAGPVGERDARKVMALLGVKKGSAVSAAVVSYAASQFLDVDAAITLFTPALSKVRASRCVYGNAILDYKVPLLCEMCTEYNRGIAKAAGVGLVRDPRRISNGHAFCTAIFEGTAPAHARAPGRLRMDFVIRLVRSLANKNALMVSTLSALLVGLGLRASEVLGSSAALIPARGAYEAGVRQGPVFFRRLGLSGGLEDAASLVCGVRETVGCTVKKSYSGGGFSLVTEKCPQAGFCRRGEFLEVACVSYTRGLLSRFGDFDARSGIRNGVCNQEFALRIVPRVPVRERPAVCLNVRRRRQPLRHLYK